MIYVLARSFVPLLIGPASPFAISVGAQTDADGRTDVTLFAPRAVR